MASATYKLAFNGNTLTYPGWNGFCSYEVKEGPTYTTLWETDAPAKNKYSITLNDSINNYNELIVYGWASRDNQRIIKSQNRYIVTSGHPNRCTCYVAGKWNDAANGYILSNFTNIDLSGTSGYISSSCFVGIGSNSNNFNKGMFDNRQVDIHPYKIVGVKES